MSPAPSSLLALALSGDALYTVIGWTLLGGIVVAFLLLGFGDLRQLSWARISAISRVSFDESIRRRVLWVTPLAILGAVVVGQLQHAVDPQDAIRQTTKICLFATGLVVTLVALILASTNLQKEIETRVIYTIVTKPTTRLEIVLGKVWGFAKVSATILLIMGVFTYAYLHVREWRLLSSTAVALEEMKREEAARNTVNASRASLEHYQRAGLLSAKAMTPPESLELLGRPPVEGEPRWLAGGQGQRFSVRFRLTEEHLHELEDVMKAHPPSAGPLGAAFVLNVPVATREPTPAEYDLATQLQIPMLDEQGVPMSQPSDPQTADEQQSQLSLNVSPAPASGPTTAPATAPAAEPPAAPEPEQPKGRPTPMLNIAVHNMKNQLVLTQAEMGKNGYVTLPPQGPAIVPVGRESLEKLFEAESFTFGGEGHSPAVEYAIGDKPVTLQILKEDGTAVHTFEPLAEPVRILGSMGRYGTQLIGGPEGKGGIAVFHYRGVKPDAAEGDQITFEVKAGIERGGEQTGETEILPHIQFQVFNPKTGTVSKPQFFRLETNRIGYVSLPKSDFPQDGNFDILLRNLTPGQWIGIAPQTVSIATGSSPFAWNLVKSLLIIWLMSILVVTIAVFASTFLSWPVAVVLTLVILFGRWGVNQIGDAGGQSLGSLMTGQTANPTQAKVTRTMVDALTRSLTVVSAFLPDVAQFEATTDIERGISIPWSRFGAGGWVLLGYGVPMVLLAYMILKYKEVAP